MNFELFLRMPIEGVLLPGFKELYPARAESVRFFTIIEKLREGQQGMQFAILFLKRFCCAQKTIVEYTEAVVNLESFFTQCLDGF